MSNALRETGGTVVLACVNGVHDDDLNHGVGAISGVVSLNQGTAACQSFPTD